MENACRAMRAFAAADPEFAREIQEIEHDPSEIAARFGSELAFGTAGLRGVMGAGSARMNLYTVSRATNGLYDHIAQKAASPAFVIAYDTRNHSADFAHRTAQVLCGRGGKVYLAPRPVPVPFLSFSIRALGADAGVCITASHNPKEYNGYKAYGADGCQLLDADAHAVEKAMRKHDYFEPIGESSRGSIETIPESVFDAYFSDLKQKALLPERIGTQADFSIVYSPLNGTGLEFVPRALSDLGFSKVYLVDEQARHDGNFPTCPRPNPELPEALKLAIALAEEKRADLVLATDPDCDRVGIAVPDKAGNFRLLTGNETGLLLLDFLCRANKRRPAYACTTIVSTPLADPIARSYGVEMKRVLTGFKYIGTFVEGLAKENRSNEFLLGFEESYGYLSSDRVRDKDACEACARICEMARDYHASAFSLSDALEALYCRYGYAQTALINVEYQNASQAQKARARMEELRLSPPDTLCGQKVVRVCDYLAGTIRDASGVSDTGLPRADVLSFETDTGEKVMLRPSGTEPKCKLYLFCTKEKKDQACAGLKRLQEEASAWFD